MIDIITASDGSLNIISSAEGPPGQAGVGIPAGGLQNQVLIKLSDADYDVGWATIQIVDPSQLDFSQEGNPLITTI